MTPTASPPSGSSDSRSPGAPGSSRCAGAASPPLAQQPDRLPAVDQRHVPAGQLRPRQQQHVGQQVIGPPAQRRADDDLVRPLGQGVRQRQLQVGLVLGGRRGDRPARRWRPRARLLRRQRVEVADQQVDRPAPGPRVGRAAVGGDHAVARRRGQACRRLRLGLPPTRKMRKCVLLDHPEQQKSDPAGSPADRVAASLRRHYPSGSWGRRHVFPQQHPLAKGPTSQPGSPSSPCPVCSAGNSH